MIRVVLFLRCALIAFALRPAAGVAQTGPDAEELFARGVQLHQSGDILGAIQAYQEALAREPSRIDARSNLGAAYVHLGRYADAAEQYEKALTIDPDNMKVRFNLALALYKGANVPEAAEELKRVIDRDPRNKSARLLLADCDLQMGQNGLVVSLLSGRDAEFGDDRLFAYLLGNALIRRDDVQRGQAYIDQLFHGGDTAEARLLMGVAQLRRQDFRAALTELQRAVELNPSLPTVYSFYGRALMGTGRRPEAADAFRKELERNPNDFDSNLYLGLLMKDNERLDESLDHLKRAGRLRPKDSRVLYGTGGLHLLAGRTDEAQRDLEALIEQVPDYEQGHVLLAKVYYRQKKKDLGDRERAIVEKLKAERQAKEPGASDELGPAYRGEPLPEEKQPAADQASGDKKPRAGEGR
jgi:tetratricopeptide (TPR) repeat protein